MDMPGKTLWFYAGEVKTNIFEEKKKKKSFGNGSQP